jgi:hypothetical protein
MALKFKTPEIKQQRLKILVYGEMGSGKSTLACSFPNTAYFDTEDSTSKIQYAKAITANHGAVINTGDMDEIIAQVKELAITKHNFKTIVLDSFTVAYENAQVEGEKKVGTQYGAHTAYADNKAKQLTNLLLRADMDVIVTCQAKREYAVGMKEVIGMTYVGYKRLGYIFDLVFETSVLGRTFNALVRKSRLNSFKTGDEVKFNYTDIMALCAQEVKDSVPIPLVLASEAQVKEVERLIKLLNVSEDAIGKWFAKENVESFAEMEEKALDKYIDAMHKRIEEK